MSKEEKDIEHYMDYYQELPIVHTSGISKIKEQMSKGLGLFLVIASSILLYFVFLRATDVFSGFDTVLGVLKPVMYGFVIAFLLNPMVKKIEDFLNVKLKKRMSNQDRMFAISRGLGIFTSIATLLIFIVLLINLIIPELFESILNVVQTVPTQLADLVVQINQFASENDEFSIFMADAMSEATIYFKSWIQTDLLTHVNGIMSNLTVGVITAVKELFNFIMGIIISIYILYSREIFGAQSKKVIYALLPVENANLSLHIAKKSNDIFIGFVIGKIIDSIIIGAIAFVVLSIMQMPYILLVTVIIGVTNVIPFFGPYIGGVPCTILIFLQDPMQGLYFVIFIVILQQIDGNIIGPKILGDSTGLSSFWVIVAILLGGGLFGFVGMIVGVPGFAVLYYICQVVINQKLEKKLLPTSTQQYTSGCYVDTITKEHISKEK